MVLRIPASGSGPPLRVGREGGPKLAARRARRAETRERLRPRPTRALYQLEHACTSCHHSDHPAAILAPDAPPDAVKAHLAALVSPARLKPDPRPPPPPAAVEHPSTPSADMARLDDPPTAQGKPSPSHSAPSQRAREDQHPMAPSPRLSTAPVEPQQRLCSPRTAGECTAARLGGCTATGRTTRPVAACSPQISPGSAH